jgi:uncharacterized protein YecE (DUF72 family)
VSAPVRVGVAGWSLPRQHQHAFPAEGTHLQRYAARLPAVEINSSFYRPHRPATYERWASSVPRGFRFAVKVPRAVTHERRLVDVGAPLDAFLTETAALGARLGCLLVQLPPSLAFDAAVVSRFLRVLRARHDGDVALEPRHRSWFESAPGKLLARHRVARVAADPAVVPEAAEPAGWDELVYLRLHGSPRMYYSSYEDAYLDALASRLAAFAARARATWCMFDNTAHSHAAGNAVALLERLERGVAGRRRGRQARR